MMQTIISRLCIIPHENYFFRSSVKLSRESFRHVLVAYFAECSHVAQIPFLPTQISYGVLMSSSPGTKTRFSKYTAVFTASSQRNTAICFACSIVCAHSTIVRLSRSALPFCSGVYGADVSCLIPRVCM